MHVDFTFVIESVGLLGGIFNDIFGGGSNNHSTTNAASGVLSNAATQLSPLTTTQINYEKSLEPQRQTAINDEIQSLNPAGIQSNINQFGAGANERAGVGAADLALTNAGSGLGSAATAGQASNLFQNAQNQTNQYAAQVNSPSARSQQLQQMIGAVVNGQSPTSLAQELGLYAPLQQTAQFGNQLNQQSNQFLNSVLGGLGGVAGSVLGGDALGGIGTLLGAGKAATPDNTTSIENGGNLGFLGIPPSNNGPYSSGYSSSPSNFGGVFGGGN